METWKTPQRFEVSIRYNCLFQICGLNSNSMDVLGNVPILGELHISLKFVSVLQLRFKL